MVKRLLFRVSILCVLVLIVKDNYAQNLSSVQQALYYESYQKANQLAGEQVLKSSEIGKALFWQSFAALETHDKDLLSLNVERAKNTSSNKWDPYLTLVPIFYDIYNNNVEKAKKLCDSVLKVLDFKDTDLLLAVAASLIAYPNHHASYVLNILERVPVKKRNSPFYYQIKGDAHRRLIQGSQAVMAYQKAIELQPDFAKAYVSIARIYQTQNNHTIAIQYLEKAIEVDSLYSPALFELFYSSYYSQPAKAKDYLEKFAATSEMNLSQLYMQMDFYFSQSQFKESIEIADQILNRQNNNTAARVYKLKAYSFAALKDSSSAYTQMERYFQIQPSKELIWKDFIFYSKLVSAQKNSAPINGLLHQSLKYATNKADSLNSYHLILENVVHHNEQDSILWYSSKIHSIDKNYLKAIDLYHWGMVYYQREQYDKSDEVFTIYTKKYPNEVYGWLWKARALSNQYEKMYDPITISSYEKVIEIGEKEISRFQNIVIQAHGYLGAYYANQNKNYQKALTHFKAILKIDAHHYDAQQYVDLLEDWVALEQ